ncbi:hypothetical protein BCR39DRAFT_526701 [Naematelia encephala]|uniref:Pentacotripeptide-repeat region of PRORP domain-containing protein n=1 Tax=Naematelia encephala TaxID=71784 RepID=A0A1Y2B9K1_9TREE|nr:hypothetical protein BCR39DRAFT_526701 [Naematelia encephala]
MIRSIRYECSRAFTTRYTNLPSIITYPHAESSRQAQARAAYLRTYVCCVRPRIPEHVRREGRKGAAAFSRTATSLAAAEAKSDEDQQWDKWSTPENSTASFRPGDSPSSMSRARAASASALYEPKNLSRPEQTGFNALIRSNALEAFTLLGSYDDEETMRISVESLDLLLAHLRVEYARDAALFRLIPRARVKRAMDSIQDIIYHSALRSRSSVVDDDFRRLYNILSLCAWFSEGERLKKILYGAVQRQIKSGQPALLYLESLVDQLVQGEQWRLIIDLFSHPLFPAQQPSFPSFYLTRQIITALMAARIGIGEPFAVHAHFAQFEIINQKPTGTAYNLLVRAHISMGNYAAANQAMDEAKASGSTGETEQLLAALQGHRNLGLDPALERRVVENLARLDAPTARAMLHELIHMRISAYQRSEAKALLDNFDLSMGKDEGPSNGKIPPDDETIILAFHLISLRPIPQDVQEWWTLLRSSSLGQRDQVIAILIRAMGRIGLAKEAFLMVDAAVRQQPLAKSDWTLPSTAEIGIATCNSLMKLAAKDRGSSGLFAVSKLMRKASVVSNEETVLIVLDFARKKPNSNPTNMAKLLNRMLKNAIHVQPTIAHLDSLMASAVKCTSSTASTDLQSLPIDSEDKGLTVGLVPAGRFADSIFWVIEILRTRGASGSTSAYANRLQYDAGHSRSIRGVPAARVVWNQLVERGFRPTTRHLLSLMKGYAQAGALGEAKAVLHLAKSTGNPVTRGMLMVLMEAYGRRGSIKQAREVFEEIRSLSKEESSQGLDIVAVTSMTKLMIDGNKRKNAVYLVREELEPLAVRDPLDEPAIVAGTKAYFVSGKHDAALRFVQRHSSGQFSSNSLRYVVQKIRYDLCNRIRLQQNSPARLPPDVLRSVFEEESSASWATSSSLVEIAKATSPATQLVSSSLAPVIEGHIPSSEGSAKHENNISMGHGGLSSPTTGALDETASLSSLPKHHISPRLRTLMSSVALANFLLAQDDIARPESVRHNLGRKEYNGLDSKLQRNRLASIVRPRTRSHSSTQSIKLDRHVEGKEKVSEKDKQRAAEVFELTKRWREAKEDAKKEKVVKAISVQHRLREAYTSWTEKTMASIVRGREGG